MGYSKQQGLTLIELLIVVVIIGFLMSGAFYTYQGSVLRSSRAEAKTELLQVAADQERWFSNNNSYSTNALPLIDTAVRTTINGFYTIAVAACATGTIANCFVATATTAGGQAADICTTLTLSSIGVRGATGDTSEECWQR